MTKSSLFLGSCCPLDGGQQATAFHIPPHHLTTHAVVVGMTGSGKTGLLTVMVEEALRERVPVLMIDVKGDLPNLLLAFPSFESALVEPWVEPGPADTRTVGEIAAALAAEREHGLKAWGIGEGGLRRFAETTSVRVITPGSTAGEPLHVLSSLEHPVSDWKNDPEAARASVSAAVSLLLRLLGRDADPASSRDHVVLSVLAERRLREGAPSDLASLLEDLAKPPIERIGALPIEKFLPKRERAALAAALNTLLASPTFATWRTGTQLDVKSWLTPKDGRTPAVIVSVAHLDDDERALVLGVLLEEILTWVRGLSGSKRLRALVVFDEVYGFLPPHPANPPTKRPLVSLMKQARAFGVGVVIATQNPMDLDYRALGNAGMWCVGRLQTDADRARVLEGLCTATNGGGHNGDGGTLNDLSDITKRLAPRWFLMRDAHSPTGTVLVQPRWAMTFMRGPMTGTEVRRARCPRAP
ncbi:MAG TPA: helicase HerA-like domain-containing protein [Polyangiaceae bacterium]|nr:helicase HerA-like domain-containing protein [Polyangiaceae bacterium]